jgi:hypothetical protein
MQATNLGSAFHLTGRSPLMRELEKKQRSQVIVVGPYVLSDLTIGSRLPQLAEPADDGEDNWREIRKPGTRQEAWKRIR